MDFKTYFDNAAPTYDATTGDLMKAAVQQTLGHFNQENAYPPITKESVIHDNAAGTGIFTREVLRRQPAPSAPTINATDYSPGMVNQIRLQDLGPSVHAQVMDSSALTDFEDATFTHSYTGFAIQMMPEKGKAAKEIYRTLKPGGVAALASWYYLGWVAIVEKARRQVDPEGSEFKGPNAGEWAGEQGRKTSMDLMSEAGFDESNVEISEFRGLMKVSDWAGEGGKQFYNVMVPGITKDWPAEKKQAFEETHDALLREALERERTGKEMGFDMLGWLTIAKK